MRLIVQILSVCLVSGSLLAGSVTAESTAGASAQEISEQGISVRFIPEQLRPGDVVELRIEMSREDWGRFQLQIPVHPGLHRIAVEKVPVAYADGRYQQRESLLFQPVSSGPLAITGASVVISFQNGARTIELPDLKLRVQPFENVELSDAPQPLPPNENAMAGMSAAIRFGLTAIILLFLMLICVAYLWRSKAGSHQVETGQKTLRTNHVVHELRSGAIPKHDLERILNDSGSAMSVKLRTALEQAVYSEDCQPTELATLLQKELPA